MTAGGDTQGGGIMEPKTLAPELARGKNELHPNQHKPSLV